LIRTSWRTLGEMVSIIQGIYKHYKGNNYQVYGVAKHSEGEPDMVVYRPLYGDRQLWVRPLDMFLETVEVNGQKRPRFEFLEQGNE
jgi:hypothetical protein